MALELLGEYGFQVGPDVDEAFRRANALGPEAREWLLALLRERHGVAL